MEEALDLSSDRILNNNNCNMMHGTYDVKFIFGLEDKYLANVADGLRTTPAKITYGKTA